MKREEGGTVPARAAQGAWGTQRKQLGRRLLVSWYTWYTWLGSCWLAGCAGCCGRGNEVGAHVWVLASVTEQELNPLTPLSCCSLLPPARHTPLSSLPFPGVPKSPGEDLAAVASQLVHEQMLWAKELRRG